MSPRLTVLTAAYQRADTLGRLYASLLEQGCEDFEWLVVDDGSTDGTEELIRNLAARAPFAIRYAWQPNRGKHAAVNRGVALSEAEFCALIDSDDWYAPGALADMLVCWESIPGSRRSGFANVEGLRVDQDGRPLGDRYPADVFDSNAFEIGALHGVRGDSIGMYRRDLLAAFPFPEDLGWHVTPSVVWNRIAARHATRFVNQVWAFTEYREGGLSARDAELRLAYPEAQLLYWSEYAAMPRPMRLAARLRANANGVRYALLTGVPLWRAPRHAASLAWGLATLPLGSYLCWRDRRLAYRLSREREG